MDMGNDDTVYLNMGRPKSTKIHDEKRNGSAILRSVIYEIITIILGYRKFCVWWVPKVF